MRAAHPFRVIVQLRISVQVGVGIGIGEITGAELIFKPYIVSRQLGKPSLSESQLDALVVVG